MNQQHAAPRHETTRFTLRPRGSGKSTTHRAAVAEGNLIRLAGRLAADVQGNAERRKAHSHCVTGYLMALEAEGIIPATRVMAIRKTCMVLLDGDIELDDLRAMRREGTDIDPEYVQAMGLVRRAGHADVQQLSIDMQISQDTAQRLVDRMESSGLVLPPDMFGTRALKMKEQSHG